MGPLDIPRLNWNGYLGNGPVAAAYRDLKRLTSRTIALHSRSLVPAIRRSFYCAWSSAIHIFIDEYSPNAHHAAVHELLHGILVEEGYHKVAARLPNPVQEILSNELQHPEIFRRMEAYGLDMAPYWNDWSKQLRVGLDEMKGEAHNAHAPSPISRASLHGSSSVRFLSRIWLNTATSIQSSSIRRRPHTKTRSELALEM